jgi:hypothetical protein
MAKRRGAQAGVVGEGRPGGAAPGLYDTPEELRAGGSGREEDGADRWLTGIEEVSLPIEYKLKARAEVASAEFLSHFCLTEHRGHGARQSGHAGAARRAR